MRKIIPLALAAVFASAACISARSAVAVIDPKGAAEFVLKTCLPAMDDLANVETMARERNWFRLPYIPSSSKSVGSISRWMANGFWAPRKIDFSANRDPFWSERLRIGTGTKPNHSGGNLVACDRRGLFFEVP